MTADQADRRLDRLLRGMFRSVPLGAIMKSVRNGEVRVNGVKTSGDARLLKGDTVSVPWARAPEPARRAKTGAPRMTAKELVTLFRGDYIWCVDKPAGLLSQPDRPAGDSVITRAWAALGWDRTDFRPALIGRLDRNASGAETIAMTAPAMRSLSEAVRSGLTGKIYIAVVAGDAPDDGEIAIPLIKDAERNFVRAARRGERGLDALTQYRKLSGDGAYSMLEVSLITGRPHQARVHLASIGCPIAGDLKYGSGGAQYKRRLMLHAHKISFPEISWLPAEISGREIVSPVPPEFYGMINSKLRRNLL